MKHRHCSPDEQFSACIGMLNDMRVAYSDDNHMFFLMGGVVLGLTEAFQNAQVEAYQSGHLTGSTQADEDGTRGAG